ncbi:MAG: hypothetical protein QM753_08860 [Thermomicrobiales bacterium]
MSQRTPQQVSISPVASRTSGRDRTGIVARLGRFIVPGGLTLALLAGCGSSGSGVKEDRQFANGAKTAAVEEPTSTVADVTPTASSGSVSENVATNPFSTRGAPQHAWIWDGDVLTVIGVSGAAPTMLQLRPPLEVGAVIHAIAASPTGDRIAVLAGDAAGSAASLRVAVYDSDGLPITGAVNVTASNATPAVSPRADATAQATPTATPVASTMSWSPAGDALVVGVAGTSIVVVGIDGSTLSPREAIAVPDAAGTVSEAWMSPRGDSLLLLLKDPSGNRAIATISLRGADRRPHVIWPGTDERKTKSVRDAAWMPAGTGIVFTIERGSAVGSGNLFEISLTNLEPRVLATAGRAGPSARVGTFAVSSDGKSIAYTLETPDGDGWSFHSLWVRSIKTGSSQEVSSANGATVSQVTWTSSGLLWRQAEADGSRAELMLARTDGLTTTIASWDGTRWQAVTSPATGGVASPAASPKPSTATPESTPAS